jgi:hypothetical protein
MSKRKASLIHRGFLYAQKRVHGAQPFEGISARLMRTMSHAEAWKQGYLAARRDAKKTQ